MTEPTPLPTTPAPEPAPPLKETAPRTGWAPWKTRALRWATGLLAVFTLGLVALWLVQVQPLRSKVAALEQERQSLQAQVDALQVETARLQGVEAENAALLAAKADGELRSALLRAKVGTVQAEFVLASGGENADAVEALSGTDDELETLERLLTGAQQEAARSLRYRLAMAAEEITAANAFAAQRDLEVLADGLDALELDLFGG